MTFLKDLIHIPESVDKGQFVLKLTDGVIRAEETVADYVVTDELVKCYRDALNYIKDAVESNTSKAAYLHGSFGSGKSHFMAILTLILGRNPAVGKLTKLAAAIDAANSWNEGKNFLLVPYHMIGAKNMEAGILGGYADFIRRLRPDAPIPAIYLIEDLFKDAQNLRKNMGDEKFFAGLNSEEADSEWGDVESQWDAERFERAIAAPPVPEYDSNYAPSEPRRDLASALIKNYFQSYENVSRGDGEAYVSLDAGLSIISQHAAKLGYDGVILFLDELVLWLASHAANLDFMHKEGQKLSKLVEAQHANRPIPLISFVARQRDLGELVGDSITGADKLNFTDALKHWEGRFHKITLEDRNLPAIAEARILKPVSDKARELLRQAFEETAKIRSDVMNTLLTSKYDREIFKKVYPFSPALVDTLVGVSSLLQRERTALKVMMLLLVSQRDHLKLGDIVPVGDLFDVIAHGDEAFNQEMALQFDNAKSLYHAKLLPLIESEHGIRKKELELPVEDKNRPTIDEKKAAAFRADDRLIKTLLLAALVPGVESLKGLNANRLAALNHGTIRTPVPGKEGGEVLRRCQKWAAAINGEIKIGEEQTNPSISIQLSGVQTERIIQQATGEDSHGNRQRLIRKMLFEEVGIYDSDQYFVTHDFIWRNTERWCEVGYGNIRSLPLHEMTADGEQWKLLIDFPFDEANHGPQDDIAKLDTYRANHPEGTKTIAWVPSFLSVSAQAELGMLVILEHILMGERFAGYASVLPFEERHIAKALLENQRSQLKQRMKLHLEVAYGISRQSRGSIDTSHELTENFVSLLNDFDPQPPAAASLKEALSKLIDQAMQRQFPSHPHFSEEPKGANLKKIDEEVQRATLQPNGRIEVDDRKRRPLLKGIAEPLKLGILHESVFLLDQHWINHFNSKVAAAGPTITVGHLRRWIDEPAAMGLSKQMQNVIILMYASRTNRTLYEHGVPVNSEVSYTKLEDSLELRTWQGPSEADWSRSIELAGSLFGLVPSGLCNATNVTRLSSDVKAICSTHHSACQKFIQALSERLKKFGLNPSDSARMQTATATLRLVNQLLGADPGEVVKVLAKANIATSEAAMGKSLKTAGDLVGRIDATTWGVFEDISQLSGEYHDKADAIRSSVSQALSADEYNIGLAATMKKAQNDAVELLAEAAKNNAKKLPDPDSQTGGTTKPLQDPGVTQVTKPEPTTTLDVVSNDGKENLSAAEGIKLLDELRGKLESSARRKLSISWSITEEVEKK